MAILLGKRKRLAEKPIESRTTRKKVEIREDSEDDDTARALFQKAFEAKFKPLEKVTIPQDEVSESEEKSQDQEDSEDTAGPDDVEGESDWSGLSDGEDEIEFVEHATPEVRSADEIRLNKKKFMSSKPPTLDDEVKLSRRNLTADPTEEEDGTVNANLKNDLALQRLLKESHLLDSSTFGASSNPEGKGRLKALDMRLQDLGAKTSTLQQEKMPYAHRKGIADKSASREASRRKEAAENGIILERAKSKSKPQVKRNRGIGGPDVGKFRGGTLQLSSGDVRKIQASGSTRGGRKGGGRGRGGKR